MKKSHCITHRSLVRRCGIALCAFLVWGCHGQTNSSTSTDQSQNSATAVKHAQAPAKPLDKGLTDTVYCTGDSSQKYSVYLPSSYNSSKKWPIIYFFDPHGAGNLPVKLYKDLADKYGYILAGTYNSRNGMQWSETEKAAQTFMQDTWQRLSIDNSRIYTFGFSGGARVSCSLALYDGGIAGVVACGGGFPERNPSFRQPFAFIGFVGERDFNYTEMKQLDKMLNNTQLPHQLIVYHGKHQWPPMNEAEQAFQWFDVNAMRLHFIPRNDSIIKAIETQFDKELEKYHKQKIEVQEYYTYKKMINYIGDMVEVKADVAKMNELEKSVKVKMYLQSEEADEHNEMETQNQFMNFLSDKDIGWWQSTVESMRNTIKKDTLAFAALQNQRLLSYLSLATYMGASQAFKAQNDGATAHFLELYKLVDPTNPEHSYMFACLYARENNSSKALSSLEDAVKLGFSDLKRMQSDSNFVAIREQPAFKELVKKISSLPPKVDMTQ